VADRNEARIRRDRPDVDTIEQRIRRILTSKGSLAIAYWEGAGKRRFEKEAIQDGLTADEAAALIAKINGEIHDVDLDDVLRDLAARHVSDVQSEPEQRRVRE
jgi:hypothetical protein